MLFLINISYFTFLRKDWIVKLSTLELARQGPVICNWILLHHLLLQLCYILLLLINIQITSLVVWITFCMSHFQDFITLQLIIRLSPKLILKIFNCSPNLTSVSRFFFNHNSWCCWLAFHAMDTKNSGRDSRAFSFLSGQTKSSIVNPNVRNCKKSRNPAQTL